MRCFVFFFPLFLIRSFYYVSAILLSFINVSIFASKEKIKA